MREQGTGRDRLDAALGPLFAAMREEDRQSAPELPAALLADGPVPVPAHNPPAPRKLAGALAAAVVLAMLIPAPEQSPDELYREVMSASVLMTEPFASTPAVLLPEYTEFDLYFDTPPDDSNDYWN